MCGTAGASGWHLKLFQSHRRRRSCNLVHCDREHFILSLNAAITHASSPQRHLGRTGSNKYLNSESSNIYLANDILMLQVKFTY